MSELCFLSIAEAARAIAARDLSPVALTEAFLARIEALDGTYRCFVRLRAEDALADARAAERDIAAGRYRGPLHAIPIGLKDIVDTAGIGTENGSALDRGRVPDRDAACWARLKAAGAILLGKLQTHEFAIGGPQFLEDGSVRAANPWGRDRYMGGSSSGPASAVALGLCMGAVGTDTAGSIRIPAAYCGIFGHKPSHGMVGLAGIAPLSATVDHAGPMTWTAEDGALMLAAMAEPVRALGPAPDLATRPDGDLRGLRIGFARHWHSEDIPATPEMAAALEDAAGVFARLGAEVEEMRLPDLGEATACNTVIYLAEAFAHYRDRLASYWRDWTPTARDRLALGALVSADDLARARQGRDESMRAFGVAMAGFDLVLTACVPQVAPLLSATRGLEHIYGVVEGPAFDAAFNLWGAPAASICSGFDAAGLPLAVQLGALPGRDADVLRAAIAYERVTPWRDRRPAP
ncbi:MAG: amidase [Proteobacteria bacterium]|nr:amidase [Pseudomonadota bacterium]